jgi:hypothetical protein
MFREDFPSNSPELKPELLKIAEVLEQLKGLAVAETSIDQDGKVTLVFDDGRKLSFGIMDEDHLRIDNFEISDEKK